MNPESNLKKLIIQIRENFINWILNVDPGRVLNSPDTRSGNILAGEPLGQVIKKALNHIKAESITTDGQLVDYKKLTESSNYKDYRELVGNLRTFDFRTLRTPSEQLGFWINLYNSLVIDAVIQAKVQGSVTESWLGVMGFFQKAAYQIGSERFSLTDIEHGVLRANRGFPHFPGAHFSPDDPRMAAVLEDMDPRIHFALNCASNSCPPIGVYGPEWIDDQLDLAARNFINGDSTIDHERRVISISKIFLWYKDDFGGTVGTRKMLSDYLEPAGKEESGSNILSRYRLKYHPYDWGLNKLS